MRKSNREIMDGLIPDSDLPGLVASRKDLLSQDLDAAILAAEGGNTETLENCMDVLERSVLEFGSSQDISPTQINAIKQDMETAMSVFDSGGDVESALESMKRSLGSKRRQNVAANINVKRPLESDAKDDQITASTNTDCHICKATNGKWYAGVGDGDFGPFNDEEEAYQSIKMHFGDPGGYSRDNKGTIPPPPNPSFIGI